MTHRGGWEMSALDDGTLEVKLTVIEKPEANLSIRLERPAATQFFVAVATVATTLAKVWADADAKRKDTN